MKRGNVSSREGRKPETFIGIRVSINGSESEPMRVRGRNTVPAVGEVFRAHPTRIRKALFAKNYILKSIEQVDGIDIYHIEPASKAQ